MQFGANQSGLRIGSAELRFTISSQFHFLPPHLMSRLTYLFKSVCGLSTQRRLDGRLLPASAQGCKPVVIVHDRRLSAGVFEVRRRGRKSKTPLYRVAVWRTYRLRSGTERATTQLFRDELDPALALLAKCAERMSTG